MLKSLSLCTHHTHTPSGGNVWPVWAFRVQTRPADPRRVRETESQLQAEAEGVRGSGNLLPLPSPREETSPPTAPLPPTRNPRAIYSTSALQPWGLQPCSVQPRLAALRPAAVQPAVLFAPLHTAALHPGRRHWQDASKFQRLIRRECDEQIKS